MNVADAGLPRRTALRSGRLWRKKGPTKAHFWGDVIWAPFSHRDRGSAGDASRGAFNFPDAQVLLGESFVEKKPGSMPLTVKEYFPKSH